MIIFGGTSGGGGGGASRIIIGSGVLFLLGRWRMTIGGASGANLFALEKLNILTFSYRSINYKLKYLLDWL